MSAKTMTLIDEITRTATGDTRAFRRLYAALAPAALLHIRQCLPDVHESTHVLVSTFIEVRWMARHYSPRLGEVPGWVLGIAGRRAAERQTVEVMSVVEASMRADHNRHLRCELRNLLGGGVCRTATARARAVYRSRRLLRTRIRRGRISMPSVVSRISSIGCQGDRNSVLARRAMSSQSRYPDLCRPYASDPGVGG